jgi:hypothetical protein
MNNIKLLLSFFLIVISYVTASAQFRVGLNLGEQLSQINFLPNSVGSRTFDKGYANKATTLGICIEQQLWRRIKITALSTVSSRYNVHISSAGIVPYTKMKFRTFQNSLLLNYLPFSFIKLGVGASMNYIPIIKEATNTNFEGRLSDSRIEFGEIFSLGIPYKNKFLLDFYYYKGLKYIIDPHGSGIIQPINTFGVSLNYLFTLSKTKK